MNTRNFRWIFLKLEVFIYCVLNHCTVKATRQLCSPSPLAIDEECDNCINFTLTQFFYRSAEKFYVFRSTEKFINSSVKFRDNRNSVMLIYVLSTKKIGKINWFYGPIRKKYPKFINDWLRVSYTVIKNSSFATQ
jgi:hypothetical protein